MKQEKVGLNHRNVVHLFTLYELIYRKKLKPRFYPRYKPSARSFTLGGQPFQKRATLRPLAAT